MLSREVSFLKNVTHVGLEKVGKKYYNREE